MIALIALTVTMFFIAATAVTIALRWPATITWVHVTVAVVAPIAAETINLFVR